MRQLAMPGTCSQKGLLKSWPHSSAQCHSATFQEAPLCFHVRDQGQSVRKACTKLLQRGKTSAASNCGWPVKESQQVLDGADIIITWTIYTCWKMHPVISQAHWLWRLLLDISYAFHFLKLFFVLLSLMEVGCPLIKQPWKDDCRNILQNDSWNLTIVQSPFQIPIQAVSWLHLPLLGKQRPDFSLASLTKKKKKNILICHYLLSHHRVSTYLRGFSYKTLKGP